MQSEGNLGGDVVPAAPVASPKIGRIVSISGPRVVVLLDQDLTGRTASVQVGMLVTVYAPNTSIFGLVEGLTIPMPRTSDDDKELRVAEVSLLGEVPRAGPNANRFQRGVTQLPCLDEMVTLAVEPPLGVPVPDVPVARVPTVTEQPVLAPSGPVGFPPAPETRVGSSADDFGVDHAALTPREREVVRLVAQGMTSREVAAALYVTPKAISYHLGNVFAKLGVTSRRQLWGRRF